MKGNKESDNPHKATLQPSWTHAYVKFNNQNSILLATELNDSDRDLVGLLHGNRIYCFERTEHQYELYTSVEQNIFLNLLTTPKYRSMSAMYMIFRLLDNLFLLTIIVLSIINGALTLPSATDLALISAIGLELIYHIIFQTSKYWFLERLSFYIGIVSYMIYISLVLWKYNTGEFIYEDFSLVIMVIAARFIAFILEVCVDIAIDAELHNDLLKLQSNREQMNHESVAIDVELHNDLLKEQSNGEQMNHESNETTPLLRSFLSYYHVSNQVKMPNGIIYKGSIFAWSPYSVFNTNVWEMERFPLWLVLCLCFLPFIITFILAILMVALFFTAAIMPGVIIYSILFCCYCQKNPNKLKEELVGSNFWKELSHF